MSKGQTYEDDILNARLLERARAQEGIRSREQQDRCGAVRTLNELDERLTAAGVDPSDVVVQTVKTIVSGYYAERTAEVLMKVRDVLDKFGAGELH